MGQVERAGSCDVNLQGGKSRKERGGGTGVGGSCGVGSMEDASCEDLKWRGKDAGLSGRERGRGGW